MSAPIPATDKPFQSLAARLVRTVVSVCLGCASLAILLQGWQVWRETEQAHVQATRDIGRSHVPLLGTALWDIDIVAVQRQIDELVKHPQVAGVRLTTAAGQIFSAGKPPLDGHADAEIAVPGARPGAAPLGKLAIAFDRSELTRRLFEELLQTVLVIGVLSALIGGLLIRFLRRELSAPLQRIAEYTRKLSPGELTSTLELGRFDRPWKDDFDLVADAFLSLRAGIVRFAQERDAALSTLAAERDLLDAVVQERTADLIRLNTVLESISRLSSRLIHLPPEEYPKALRAALDELATSLRTQACAIAERTGNARWQWRFVGGAIEASALEEQAITPLWNGAPGWHTYRSDDERLQAASAALSDAVGREAIFLCSHENDQAGHLLIAIGVSDKAFIAQDANWIELVAKALFGALGRWRGLVELEATRQELFRQSRSDALTGVANRRELDERKLQELRIARRTHQPFTLILLDIDFFKRFNDRYGHPAGDRCLISIARCLQEKFKRPTDSIIRLGGEEFALLLPNTGLEQGVVQGERIRQAIRELGIQNEDAPLGQVTVSIGMATLTPGKTEPLIDAAFDQIMQTADEALYLAKAQGRDRIVARAVN